MEKSITLTVALILISALGYSQDPKPYIYLKFQDLVHRKIDYEKFQYLTNRYPDEHNSAKLDSAHRRYRELTEEIKKSPEIYLDYIKRELKSKDTTALKLRVLYKFLNFNDPSIMNYKKTYHYLKKGDFLRVIKYSLFDRNDEFLPEDFRGIPVVDIDDYNGYNELKPKEFRNAARFILKEIPLNKKEIAFIKNKQNPKAIVDIKKYLDKNGLNKESKEFIKWAIKNLVPDIDIRLSLGILEMNYIGVKNSDYVPRDREPGN